MQQSGGSRMGFHGLATRLRVEIWTGSTTEVELVLALLLTLRASWMLTPTWHSIPLATQGYLIPAGLPEWGYGALLMVGAIAQAVTALARGPAVRACTTALLAVFQTSVVLAYWQSGEAYRGVVPLIVGMALAEWWISWRAWSDRLTVSTLIDRRQPGWLHASTSDG